MSMVEHFGRALSTDLELFRLAATGVVLYKKALLKNSQISHENTSVGVCFRVKFAKF